MKPEQKLWLLIKDHLSGQVDRVENVAGVGMPDVYACYNGHDYWVELKVQKPSAEHVDPLTLLRPAQKAWHIKRAAYGGFTYILVRNGDVLSLYVSEGTKSQLEWRSKKPWLWDDFSQIVRGE